MMRWLALLIGTCLKFGCAEALEMKEEQPKVVFETNIGKITISLYPKVAPKACENFLGLVDKHYYDGIAFHRVIKNFMIQGGDPDGTGAGGKSIWGTCFEDECDKATRFDRPGILAMANRGANTNGSQFFITTVQTPWLHMKHTIFGEVTSGMEVVRKIESASVDARDRPVQQIKIVKAYRG
jgi:peptidylprolyl isomerase